MATLILSLAVAGLSSVFVSSAETAAVARSQADATDIATSEIEIIRASAYQNVGISLAADGYVATFEGRRTVTEDDENIVLPRGSVDREGAQFVIERSVTWAPLQGNPEAYKIVTIVVEWEAFAGQRQVVLQTGIYEGADDA